MPLASMRGMNHPADLNLEKLIATGAFRGCLLQTDEADERSVAVVEKLVGRAARRGVGRIHFGW